MLVCNWVMHYVFHIAIMTATRTSSKQIKLKTHEKDIHVLYVSAWHLMRLSVPNLMNSNYSKHDKETKNRLTKNIRSSWSCMSFIPGKAATPWIISTNMQPTPLPMREENRCNKCTDHSE